MVTGALMVSSPSSSRDSPRVGRRRRGAAERGGRAGRPSRRCQLHSPGAARSDGRNERPARRLRASAPTRHAVKSPPSQPGRSLHTQFINNPRQPRCGIWMGNLRVEIIPAKALFILSENFFLRFRWNFQHIVSLERACRLQSGRHFWKCNEVSMSYEVCFSLFA